ncbi:MAG: MMPL family transporter [Alphaproteobacteria bacterium]
MMDRAAASLRAAFGVWVGFVARAAWAVIVFAVLLTGMAGWVTATRLGISTSTTDMLSAELPFRQDAIRISRAFPQLDDNIVIVIDAPTADQAEDAALALGAALRQRPNLFRTVFDPRGEPFLRRNGLLYRDADALSALVDRLAAAQPLLAALWRDPSLRGLFGVLRLALENSAEAPAAADFARVVHTLAGAVEDANTGRAGQVSWRAILDAVDPDAQYRRRVIVVSPALDFGSMQPASKAIDAIRDLAGTLEAVSRPGIRVRLTGSAPLAEEELASVIEGMGLAGVLSLSLVVGLLFWGLRSVRLVGATLLTLLMGLVWTAGFATLAVGRLNLISVAFAVLFIGLSVDFGIHFALRAREAIDGGASVRDALRATAASVGGALGLCALAAAIAFFSFLPTDYVGLAELGLIAGAGMFIALAANLTVLPALIAVMPPASRVRAPGVIRRTLSPFARRPGLVVGGAVLLGIGAAAMTPQARFDFDPLNLKDRRTESVSTLADLRSSPDGAPYTIEILAPDAAAGARLAARLEALPEVRRVITLARFIPGDQADKLAAIDSAAFLLLPAFQARRLPPPRDSARRAAYASFREFLADWRGPGADAAVVAGVTRLARALAQLKGGDASLADLENRLLGSLPRRLAALRLALEAGPVSAKDLPDTLRARYVAPDGAARIEVQPTADLRDPEALRRFVEAVRATAPRASGGPVIIVEAGNAVLRAFIVAAVISVLAIGLLVAMLLGRLGDVVLVFAPLLLAALLTVATAAAFGLAFNFANIIVLPLLFGLGVASAIHLVMRARDGTGLEALFATSTPRAVMFSALTTIGSFASIALSGHPGTASMGVLLAIAIALTLACTLIVLPALMGLGRTGGDRP